jgi:hypothetical protein
MPKSFQDGIAAATAIAAEFELAMDALRPFASAHLLETHPGLDEIGSSDVSIHLAALGNHQPDLLRTVAQAIRERDDLVAKVSASTGRSAEETLRNLHRLFSDITDATTEHAMAPWRLQAQAEPSFAAGDPHGHE